MKMSGGPDYTSYHWELRIENQNYDQTRCNETRFYNLLSAVIARSDISNTDIYLNKVEEESVDSSVSFQSKFSP